MPSEFSQYTPYILFVLGSVIGCIGWFSGQLWSAVQKLKEDLNALRVNISAEYVRYDRLQDALKPIMDSLNDIKSALNSKADK
jgi:hypothetical protein